MAGPTAARIASFDVLRAVRRGVLADHALNDAVATLDARDRAWTHELVYGTLRLRGRTDHIIAHHANRPAHSIDPDTLDIVRLGAYQLLDMGSVPAYAAVSESVELAKQYAPRGAGFVNAVLQSLRRAPRASTFPSFERDPVAHLVTWGSHPKWLVERWIARYGADGARRLIEANNIRPQTYLRALGEDVAGVRDRLVEAGIAIEPVVIVPRALRIVEGSVAQAVAAAPVIVQDPAAGLVADFAGVVPDRVLDLAAAPGGKAIALGCDDGASGRLVAAADISAARLDRLRGNIVRLGATCRSVVAVVADGRSPPFRPADLVLIDAPCTGTGTFRRHPDGRWRVQSQDIDTLARVQAQMLDAAADVVRPGGLLIYATCSLEEEENEMQVESFLGRDPRFTLESGVASGVPASTLNARGMLCVLPHEHGFDGAFAARLRRTG